MNQSYVTIYVNKTITLVNERFNPYVQNVTADMIDAMSILENGDIASSTGVLKDTTHNEVMAVRRGEAYYDEEGNIVYGDPNEETDEPTIPDEGDPTDPENGDEPGSESNPDTGSETGEVDTGAQGEGDNEESGDNGENPSDEPVEGEEPSIPDEPGEPDGGDVQ